MNFLIWADDIHSLMFLPNRKATTATVVGIMIRAVLPIVIVSR